MSEILYGDPEVLKPQDEKDIKLKPVEDANPPEKPKTQVKASKAEDSDEEEGPTPWWRWLIRGIVFTIVVGGIIFVIVRRDITRFILEAFFNWLAKHRWIGPIALFGIFVVAQACMIPCIALVVGAGYGLMKAYGEFWSALTVATGACWFGMWLGSIFGMLFARYMFRKTAIKMAKKHKVMAAFDMAMDSDGTMFLIIMRICPLIPFAI